MVSGGLRRGAHRGAFLTFSRLTLVSLCLVALVGASESVRAQTLDQQVVALTRNFCAGLGIPPSGTASPDLGLDLGSICRNPALCTGICPPPPVMSGPPPAVGGGGAASIAGSSSGLSGFDAVERRKEKLRRKSSDEQESLYQTASLVQVAQQEATFLGERLTAFFSVDFDDRDKSVTAFASGYDSDRLSITAGADYRVTAAFFAGLAINTYRLNGDFAEGGGFHTDSMGAIAYGSYATQTGFFADFTVGAAYKGYNVTRFISGVYNSVILDNARTDSDTDGYEVSSRLSLGKDFNAGRFTFGPRAGANYLFTHINGVQEEGTSGLQLVYDERSIDSFQSTVGLQASAAFSTGAGVIQPQVSAEWVHEFLADQQSIDVRFAEDLRPNPTWFSFQTDRPDRDFFNVRAGLVMAFPGGIQGFVEARTILGHDYYDGYGGAVGLRLPL